MSADNVTPIRPPGGGTPKTPSSERSRKSKRFLKLEERDDEPGSMRLIQALHGVCYAAERLAENSDLTVALELGTAAEILSDMLTNRVSV